MKTVVNTMLDPTRRTNDAREFESALRRKIVGQDAAVEKVVEIYQMFLAGLNPPGRPVGNLLFLGPTGSGKTRVVEAMSETLFRRRPRLHQDRLRRVSALARNRQTDWFASGIPGPSRDSSAADSGSPESVAHREAKALDSAVRRNREGFRFALAVAAGHSGQSDFDLGRQPPRRSFAMHHHHDLEPGSQRDEQHGGRRPGLCAKANPGGCVFGRQDQPLAQSMRHGANSAPEFMNRIDKSVVFRTLRPEHLEQILEIELGMVQQRILMASAVNQFVFNCTPKVKSFLLHEGTDPKYGARHLKRAIERHLVFPACQPGRDRTGEARRFHPRRSECGRQDHFRQGSRGRHGSHADGALWCGRWSASDGASSPNSGPARVWRNRNAGRQIVSCSSEARRGAGKKAGAFFLFRPVWGGHSCPPLLMLVLTFRQTKPQSKPTSKAADKSVRPTRFFFWSRAS